MNGAKRNASFKPEDAKLTVNRWILTQLTNTARDVTAAIENHRFNEAAADLYRFVWNEVCDWYLELLKPVFSGEDEAAKAEAQACVAYVLEQSYMLLHPFMPYMTEELWSHTAGEGAQRENLLCHTDWPAPSFSDDAAASEINWLIDLVTGIRSARSEMNVPPSAKAPLVVVGANDISKQRFARHTAAIERLARAEGISNADAAPKGAAQIVSGEAVVCLPLGSLIDVAAEKARIEKAITKSEQELERIEKKLGNEKFIANADPTIIAADRERKAELDVQIASLKTALQRVGRCDGAPRQYRPPCAML